MTLDAFGRGQYSILASSPRPCSNSDSRADRCAYASPITSAYINADVAAYRVANTTALSDALRCTDRDTHIAAYLR